MFIGINVDAFVVYLWLLTCVVKFVMFRILMIA
jgi:hypothetical protein